VRIRFGLGFRLGGGTLLGSTAASLLGAAAFVFQCVVLVLFVFLLFHLLFVLLFVFVLARVFIFFLRRLYLPAAGGCSLLGLPSILLEINVLVRVQTLNLEELV
jgi:hypothetical protein